MNKIIAAIILLLFVQATNAQGGIDNLIGAEKNFAAYSVAHSTKEAFLEFMDSSSIMFDNGKPVKGFEFWNKREKNAGVLNWRPQFAEISASGNFGYTTGPWTFQPSINDSIAARGQYITVWYLDKKGGWKFLVDLGVGKTPVNLSNAVEKITVKKERAGPAKTSSLVLAERAFIELSAQDKAAAYRKYLSIESILNRNGFLPASTQTEQQAIIDSTSSRVQYTVDGWGISPVPDMGYTYGTTIINGNAENYLRIWRREKAGWKIAVEVLRY